MKTFSFIPAYTKLSTNMLEESIAVLAETQNPGFDAGFRSEWTRLTHRSVTASKTLLVLADLKSTVTWAVF